MNQYPLIRGKTDLKGSSGIPVGKKCRFSP